MDTQIPKQLQDKIAQFQTLQSQLQMMSMQRQQLYMQSADTENALKALESVSGEKVYKVAGPLLIETTKEVSEKKLLCGVAVKGDVLLDEQVVGKELFFENKSRPLYISVGHKVSLTKSLEIVKNCMKPIHNMPEPIHLARTLVKDAMKRD